MDRQESGRKKKKKRRNGREHGAIAVFLTIILVPCLVVAFVFDDVCRVQLSKAQAVSAADLALEATLANYDQTLSEYYGLVASCQDIDEFYEISANYFKGMIDAADPSGKGSDLFLDYMAELKSGDLTDFLQTQIAEGMSVADMEGSALGDNPALIEDGIVEFMKYRGIPEIAMRIYDLIDRFTKSGGVTELIGNMAGMDSNKEITEKEQTYEESVSELLKHAYATYLALEQYQRIITSVSPEVPSETFYNKVKQSLNDIRDDFKGATSIITKYYSGTGGMRTVSFPAWDEHAFESEITRATIGCPQNPSDGTQYLITNAFYEQKLNEFRTSVEREIQEVQNTAQSFVTAASGITYGSGTNPALYCRKIQEADDSGSPMPYTGIILSHSETLMTYRATIKAMMDCTDDPTSPPPPGWRDGELKQLRNRIDTCRANYFSTDTSTGGDFIQIRRAYESAWPNGQDGSNVVDSVNNRKYRFTSKYAGGNKTLSEFGSAVSGFSADALGDLRASRDALDLVINGGGKVTSNGREYDVVSLTELKADVTTMVNDLDSWENTANAGTGQMAEQSAERAEKARYALDNETEDAAAGTKSEYYASQIKPETVDELNERATNILNDMDSCITAIESLAYGGKKLTELGSAEALIQAAHTVVPDSISSIITAENEEAARGYSDSLITPGSGDVFSGITIDKTSKTGNFPNMRTPAELMPTLYKFLAEKFKDNEDSIDEAQKQADENKKKVEGKVNNALTDMHKIDPYAAGHGEAIEDRSGGGTFGVGSLLKGFVGMIEDLIDGDAAPEFRDHIYFAEYVFDMFTWSSFNNEGKYKLLGNVSYKKFPYSDGDEKWNDQSITETYENQSLTNLPLVLENNHAFLGEVEYILYGEESFKDNLTAAYDHIFAIREVLDITSGMLMFWEVTNMMDGQKTDNGVAINLLARGLMAASCGIIPEALTKLIVILGLSTVEACKDIQVLKMGAPVTVFKIHEDDWYTSFNTLLKDAAEDTENPAPENKAGLYYSDYLYFFVLIGTGDNGAYKGMLLRTGDVIQANIRKKSEDSSYDLSKAKCYFKLHADLQVKPLMLGLPLATSYDGADVEGFTTNAPWCQYSVDVIRGYS